MKKLLFVVAIAIFATTQLKAQKEEVFITNSQAIRGYDPVAYFMVGRPVKGKEEYHTTWKNTTWLFSSKENLDLFSHNPEKYAPQYGGYCAYGLSEGHKASTDPNAWTIVEGKLYLNNSPKVKELWVKNIKERILAADEKWPALKDKE